MTTIRSRIAAAPISWGVCEVPDWGYQLEPDTVLTQMTELGVAATEFGPEGFLPDGPSEKADLLAAHRLVAVGQFVPVVLHTTGIDPLPFVRRALQGLVSAGASTVVIAAATGQEGYDARPVLDGDDWSRLLANLDRIDDAARAEGLTAALHPHVGTMVESGTETERVLRDSSIGLCLDTGHLLIGGGDPVAIARMYPGRIVHCHLKDVRADWAHKVQAAEVTYAAAVRAGMYVPLGAGDVDIAAIIRSLEAAGYDGWYVLEQDTMLAGDPAETGVDPRADMRASLEFVERVEAEMTLATAPYELVTMGRCGVDIYPLEHGIGLEDVTTFQKFLGGSATNVAVAAARLGRRTALITRVGNDPFGRFVQREAARLGVDSTYVTPIRTQGGPPTPVTFCEVFPPDDFPLYFYRYPTAPDLMIEAPELPIDVVLDCDVFWSTVTGLSQSPSREAHFAAWQARGRRTHTVLDLDYRAMFWNNRDEAHEQIGAALDHVTVAVGNREECLVAVGETEPSRVADALLAHGLELAVVKQGPKGVLAATAEERVEVSAFPVQVLNGLGAGDAFGGALVHGLLSGWGLRRMIEFANVAGALVASRLECSTAMPATVEVEEALVSHTAMVSEAGQEAQ